MEVREPSAKYLARPAYKQTEVGVIPEDWSISSLGRHLREKIRNGYSPVCPESFTGMWMLSLASVTPSGFQPSGVKPAPLNDPKVQAFGLSAGDIVVSRSNTPDRVGLAGIYCGIPNPCSYPDLLMRVRVDASLDSQYLLFHLLSNPGRRFFSERARGSSGSMVKIDRSMLEAFPVVLPPTKAEQQAIAEALSDADALIESLEQLLAKKRQIKQGAMQELLTGQKRLPGFAGEWEVRRLGDLLTIRHGKSQRDVESIDGAYPILATGGQIGQTNRFLYDKPSVLIGRKGTIDQPRYMDAPFWTVDTLFYSEVHEPNSARFLFYRFCLIDWKQYNEASGVPSLNARTIEGVEVLCPIADEQTAIATLLSDMDAEIAALETRLAKAHHLKQGMMQELLTGRIRLV